MSYVEPWMRGPLDGVPTLVQPMLFSFQHAREDVDKWTAGLTTEEMWVRPMELGPVGFHVRHIGGSVERLMVYVEGNQLSDQQLAELKAEMEAGASREAVLAQLNARLNAAEELAKRIDPAEWTEPRYVGRKRLPTTVAGLITHIAEHTQRHVGEVIVTAKVVRALRV